MAQVPIRSLAGWMALPLCALGACTGISIAPSCPNELGVGESGPVWANEQRPGSVPTYIWEVIPEDSGTFDDPSLPATTFTALKAGDVTIRLTARDGLFQVISECGTSVVDPVVVSLTAEPAAVEVGELVTLSCASTGNTAAVVLRFEQTDGNPVDLTPVSAGTVTFVPTQSGDLTFSCTGESQEGRRGLPSTASVSVTAPPDDDGNGDGDDDRRPPRGRG